MQIDFPGHVLSVFHVLADLLFPRLCGVCGRGLTRGEKFICAVCLADLPVVEKNSLRDKREEYRMTAGLPGDLYALFYYDKYSPYRNLIYQIKYYSRKKSAVYFGKMLGEKIAGHCKADCIIPVPLHKKRQKQRGFNQSYHIALGMAEALRIDLLDNVIFRVEDNVSQTGKSVAERRKNVENIFRLDHPDKIRGRHVLLVDDVITTGSTILACARVLSEAGNVRISFGCLARAGG